MLNITKEQFLTIYAGTKILDYIDIFFTEPVDEEDLKNNYLTSKLWRLNNVYTIVNKYGKQVKFRMNLSQHKVYAASMRHSRLIILKSRQQGISTLWLVSFFDDGCTIRNFSIGLMAQGQDEASTLLTRVKILWETLPPAFIQYLGINIDVDNTKALSLSNGSSLFVRTSFRSTTLQRLHISEMGKIANKYPEKAKETKTGTLQAIAPGNIAIIESTAEGDNLFKEMWDNSVKYFGELSAKDFYPVFLSWLDDPDCIEQRAQIITDKQQQYFSAVEKELNITLSQEQKNFWVMQYRELGDSIYQEYPTTPIEAFMANKEGAYYARLYLEWVKGHKREVPDLYDKNLDVQVAVDLGMNDTNVLTIFQDYNDSTRIIDEIYDSGQEIAYYTNQLKKKPYFSSIKRVLLPHDANVRELTSGLTRREVFESELTGVEVVVLERIGIAEGIEAVRQVIKRLWIDPKCQYLISCLFNYSKEYDDKRNRWRDKPDHNEFSNGADSLRYMAVGSVAFKLKERKRRAAQGYHDV
jgi:hypothetical protein